MAGGSLSSKSRSKTFGPAPRATSSTPHPEEPRACAASRRMAASPAVAGLQHIEDARERAGGASTRVNALVLLRDGAPDVARLLSVRPEMQSSAGPSGAADALASLAREYLAAAAAVLLASAVAVIFGFGVGGVW
jgi:hypothetical protein